MGIFFFSFVAKLMRFIKTFCVVVLVALLHSNVLAQDTVTHRQRPKVGLVLAGGGARGAAFIGVLKYLEELDFPIDYVIGSSMGSVIGGVYCLGYTPDEMAQIIRSIEWKKYIGNHIDRRYSSVEVRKRYGTQIINVPFNSRSIFKEGFLQSFVSEIPIAYVNNNDVDNLLNELSGGYHGTMDFEDLPIPFACTATDIVAGEEVVLRKGNLPKAIRASLAIPGVFTPVVIDGKLMFDGGLTNIFPADVLREIGADIVIGIEFSNEKYFSGDKLPGASKLFDYIYNFVIHFKRDENKKLCDVIIKPNTAEFSMFSFNSNAIDTLVIRGYEAAKQYHDTLLQVKQRLDSIAGHSVGKELHAPRATDLRNQSFYVQSVEMDGVSEAQSYWLKRRGGLDEGGLISTDRVKKSILYYRGTGAFDAISYDFEAVDSTTTNKRLVYHFQPNCRDVVGVGARYDTEDGAAFLLSLGLNEKSLSGFKLGLQGRLSFSPKVNITTKYSLYPIVDFNLGFEYRNQLMRLKVPVDGSLSLRMQMFEVTGSISQCQSLGFVASVGYSFAATNFMHVNFTDIEEDRVFSTLLTAPSFERNMLFGPYFVVGYDDMDHENFAKQGVDVKLSGNYRMEMGNPANTLKNLEFVFRDYITPRMGRFTLVPQMYCRAVFGDDIYANVWNTCGGAVLSKHTEGQLPFIGENQDNRVSDIACVVRCDFRYNFYGKHYLTATYNHLLGFNAEANKLSAALNECYLGLGLRYSYNSFLGPLSFTVQWSELSHRVSGYLSLGYEF